MSTTRKDLRQRLGGVGYTGDMTLSTATGGSTSSLIDTTLQSPDSTFNYAELVILTGAAVGNYRVATSWTQSTGTFVPDRNFSSTGIAAGDTYEVHRLFSASKKNVAINRAVRRAKWNWPRKVEDESLAMVANQYTYALGSLSTPIDRFKGIDRLLYDTGTTLTGFPFEPIDKDFWYLRDNAGTLTLQLMMDPPYPTKNFRLEYRAIPSEFTLDSNVLDPDVEEFAEYICAWSAALLYRDASLVRNQSAVRDDYLQKSALFAEEAERILRENAPKRLPGEVIYPSWGNAEGESTLQYPVNRIHIG